MTSVDYAARLRAKGLNTYFVAEGDRHYNVRVQSVVPANPCCNCYSVAKAFTVTAVGMMYDRGLLSPDTRVADVLSDRMPPDADPKWSEVTVHHLLLHRAGFGHGLLDIDADDASQYPTTDYLHLVLSTPLAYKPGIRHQYTDAAYYLLSRMIARVSGMDLADVLRPALMEVMRFKEFAFSTCPQGYSMGATGLYLRTEDMVKLGILYINDGVWRKTRILSKEWVDLVLQNGYELQRVGGGWYGKGGMRGQMLLLNPTQGIAVACHSYEHVVPHELLIP